VLTTDNQVDEFLTRFPQELPNPSTGDFLRKDREEIRISEFLCVLATLRENLERRSQHRPQFLTNKSNHIAHPKRTIPKNAC
jgi:hypothetical protein